MAKSKPAVERRKSERKNVLETFHVFLVIPSVGLRKLHLKDVSKHGLAFVAEPSDEFREQEIYECFFYINPSLRLPLSFKAMHVTAVEEGRRVGCELTNTDTPAHAAYVKFLDLLDDLGAFLDQ